MEDTFKAEKLLKILGWNLLLLTGSCSLDLTAAEKHCGLSITPNTNHILPTHLANTSGKSVSTTPPLPWSEQTPKIDT